VVDDFEEAGDGGLADLVDFFFFRAVGAVDEFFDFDLFGELFGGEVDAGDVGAVVEAEVGSVAQEGGDSEGVCGERSRECWADGLGLATISSWQPGMAASMADLIASSSIGACLGNLDESGAFHTEGFCGVRGRARRRQGTLNSLGASALRWGGRVAPVRACSSILRWSMRKASMRASGRGGQPGM
jgi:hypothetical protein